MAARTNPVFRLSTGRRVGLSTGAGVGVCGQERVVWRWVLLTMFREERVSRVVAETRRPTQGRVYCQFREGKNADRFERGLFVVSDIG
jgi:hypothetical protein